MERDQKTSIGKLVEEFTDLYKKPHSIIPKEIDSIIILAGDKPPIKGENVSRIKYAANLFKKFKKDIPVIFSGITDEKETIINLMISFGISKKNCHFQSCGKLGEANTKTQFETFIKDPMTNGLKNIVFVTNTYHIPRTKRTAGKFLHPSAQFSVTGDSDDWKMYNSFLKIMEEIKKIIKYSAKGDILTNPR